MIVQFDSKASLSMPTSQAERDRLDNEAVRDAWLSLAGTLPVAIEQRVARGEVFYSALDLAEHLIGTNDLAGWRVSFTTDGGPYSATLLLGKARNGMPLEIAGSHPTSLAMAFISVINEWSSNAKGHA
jgi:hypothetical protein